MLHHVTTVNSTVIVLLKFVSSITAVRGILQYSNQYCWRCRPVTTCRDLHHTVGYHFSVKILNKIQKLCSLTIMKNEILAMASVCLCNYSRACHLYNPDLLTVFLNTTVVKRCSSCDVERWISEMKLARVWEYLGEVSSKKIFHLNWSEGSWVLVWPTKITQFSCRERMYKVLEYLYKTILVCPPSSVRLRYFLLIKTKIPVNRSGFISEIFLTPSIVVVIYPGVLR